jgi:hypothetical protein
MNTQALPDVEVDIATETELPPEKVAEVTEETKPDPIAEKASKTGWTDKDAWVEAGKDPDEWVDAAEFVRRKPLFDRLHKQERALKEKEARLEAVSKYAAKVEEMTRKKVIAELEAKRLDAVQTGDTEAFERVDKELNEVRKETPVVVEPTEPEMPPHLQEFVKRNDKWFEKDEDMTDYALARAKKYFDQGIPGPEGMLKVEADVKRTFPHKFTNPNKEKPAAVGAGSGERRAKSFGYGDLDEGQRDVWRSVKNIPGMTIDKYITQLKDLGELK